MLVASYHTGQPAYEAMARRLAASCARHGLSHRVERVPDAGGWNASLRRKPGFILESLAAMRGPVLWMDADTEVLLPPAPVLDAAAAGCDFAVYNAHADPANPWGVPHRPADLLACGGVQLYGYTAAAMELLLRWDALMRERPDGLDDPMLDWCYNEHRPPVRPRWLPRECNWMTGVFGAPTPGVCVVHHYSAGRKHRDAAA